MKKIDPQDPKWTAYVLNELSPRAAKAVEEQMRNHPEARELVASIRATTGLIEAALAAEPEPVLDEAQKRKIQRIAGQSTHGRLIRFPVWVPVTLSAAAALLVAVLGVQQHLKSKGIAEEDRNVAEIKAAPDEVDVQPDMPTSPLDVADADGDDLSVDWKLDVNGDGLADYAETYRAEVPFALKADKYTYGVSGAPMIAREFAFKRSSLKSWTLKASTRNFPPPAIISPSLDDFGAINPNTFQSVIDQPLSTFSIDVDTASYSVVRKFLNDGQLPPADAVRIEELVNYFTYDYPAPKDQKPFAAHMEVAPAPWQTNHYLVRVALKGREVPAAGRPPMNLTYLIDVSGSMQDGNRLPLVKRALQMLIKQLDQRDRVAIVVYAGAAGLVLPPTSGQEPQRIIDALEQLQAGGSTAGGEGIQLAYNTARGMYQSNAVNRVILCTDGDFNVGITQQGDLERLIEQEAKSGVFLTALGFGMGNYKDSTLELLSNKGNGNYGYIDHFSEARKLLIDQMFGTLITIAKDVKIQVEFNPAQVAAYKLIGYENRMLNKEDFNNDKVDAGDIGAGHTVTAFYEIIPAGKAATNLPNVDELKYQSAKVQPVPAESADEILTLKLRHKEPDGVTSSKLEFPLDADVLDRMDPSLDFRFASAVAGFGMLLRGEEQLDGFTLSDVLKIAENATGADELGYRAEFIFLLLNAMIYERYQADNGPRGYYDNGRK